MLTVGINLPFPPWRVPIYGLALRANSGTHIDILRPPLITASVAPVACNGNVPATLYNILFACVSQMVYVYLKVIY